jgi:hypothetical protein
LEEPSVWKIAVFADEVRVRIADAPLPVSVLMTDRPAPQFPIGSTARLVGLRLMRPVPPKAVAASIALPAPSPARRFVVGVMMPAFGIGSQLSFPVLSAVTNAAGLVLAKSGIWIWLPL